MDRPSVLVEREPELAVIAELVARACGGRGCVLALEGAAGIGKTALLLAAAERASDAGMQVLKASGGELEYELAFGVAGQLLERVVTSSPPARQAQLLAGAAGLARRPLGLADADQTASVGPGPALHGLYWLLVNLSDGRPTVLIVDDVHWCDLESLSWLVYLGRRLPELPVLVGVAVRSGEPGDGPDWQALFGQLLDGPTTRLVRPGPLSHDGVATLVRRSFGGGVEEPAVRSCLTLTGGNPLALGALLTAARDDGLALTAASADRLQRLGAGAIANSVLVRIARLGGDAVVIARAIAVLGAGARLGDARVLAKISEPHARTAADALIRVGILRDAIELEFDHPLVREAVYRDIPRFSRAELHKRAARLLAGRSANDERIAAQLVSSEPAADPGVVDQLRRVARDAVRAGAPSAAAVYLGRAWEEPPDVELRASVLHELAAAETAAGSPKAEAHFRDALKLAHGRQERVGIALDLALLLSHSNRPGLGVDVLARALDGLGEGDRELALLGESALCGIALLDLTTRPRAAERLAGLPHVNGASPGERALLATRSIESVMSGESADAAASVALAALGGGRLLADVGADSQLVYLAANTLVLTDRLAEARDVLDAAVADAGRRGSVMGFVLATCWRANALLKAGSVLDAEADARASIEAARQAGLEMLEHFALAFLLDSLLELARYDDADGELSQAGLVGELPNLHHYTTLLDSRGRLRVARGDVSGGLADFIECGRRQLEWGFPNPAPMAWRSNAARAHRLLGSSGEPGELARAELALARKFGAPRPIAVALRALAAVDHDDRYEPLREAERVVRGTDARLEHAHTLVELGAELRRGNRRSDGREMLRAGLAAADRCGAIALSAVALEELAVTGSKPRRDRLSGVAVLTASERRVAQMAARGASNPEIAQALFVTRGTIESHLHAAYRKLNITSRTELAGALDAAAGRDQEL
jgi:DNA-binding CsgD family transcriptional regulator